MNSKRTDFDMSKSHQIPITPNWLLGFVKGDGSFSVIKADKILTFSITQKGNLILMNAIKSFFFDLANSKDLSNLGGYVYISKIKNTSPEAVYILSIKNKFRASSSTTETGRWPRNL
jgi:hypothetical protein